MPDKFTPSLKKPNVRYRGKTSSKEYNQMTNNLYYDLSNIFTETNKNTKEAADLIDQLTLENKILSNQIKELEGKLDNVKDLLVEIQKRNNQYNKTIFADDFKEDSDASTVNKAFIDSEHRVATLPTSGKGISKTHIWDSFKEEVFIPDELKVSFNKSIEDYVDAEENDPKNVFDGSDETTWIRKIRYPDDDPKTTEELTMYVKLPENIINNRLFNTIIVHPFPINGLDIMNIEYSKSVTSNINNAKWDRIPGWPRNEKAEPININNSGPIKFCFEDINANWIRIKIRQNKSIIENNMKVFNIGLKQFEIKYNNYTSEEASFIIPINLTAPEAVLYTIRDIKALLDNDSTISEGYRSYSLEVYGKDEFGDTEYLGSNLPIKNIKHKNIEVKVTIHADKNKESTPAVSALNIYYEAI